MSSISGGSWRGLAGGPSWFQLQCFVSFFLLLHHQSAAWVCDICWCPAQAVHTEEITSQAPRSPGLSGTLRGPSLRPTWPSASPPAPLPRLWLTCKPKLWSLKLPQCGPGCSRPHAHSRVLIHAVSPSTSHGLLCPGSLLTAFQQLWTSSGPGN